MNEKQCNEQGLDVINETSRNADVNAGHETDGDDGFKVTVRKLEMPVRPRGVLAE